MAKQLLSIALLFISISLQAQDLKISLKQGTEKEKRGKEQIEKILKRYPVITKWLLTKEVIIAENVIPFSHPVLTLNCNYLENDLLQLANLLHEQFHWYEESKPKEKENAIRDFKELFPEVPSGGKTGARDEYSTYLHLIVCDLEFQAMTEVIGENKAREILKSWKHYTWIYDKVLNDNRIRKINSKYSFLLQ